MAVTVNQAAGYIEMTEAGDEVAMPLYVKSIRFVSAVGQLAADVIEIADTEATSEVLWATYGMSATGAEAELIEKWFHNGVNLVTLTGDRGTVRISYK